MRNIISHEYANIDEDIIAEALMISASGDGETILPGGGGSSLGGITTSDSRRGKIWEDDDEDW